MKTLYSKKYYQNNREALFQKYGKHCDYEKELMLFIPKGLPEEAIPIVESMMAKKVADVAKRELVAKKEKIQRIMDGKSALGMTSERQEMDTWHNMREGFEFACYMLAEFKKKYNVA